MAEEDDISLNLIDHSQNDYVCFSVCQAMDIVPEIINGIICEVMEINNYAHESNTPSSI